MLPFNVVFGQIVAVMAGLCSAVKGSDDTVKAKPFSCFLMQNRRDPFCSQLRSHFIPSRLDEEEFDKSRSDNGTIKEK